MRTPPLTRCVGIGFALALARSPLLAEGARIVEAPGLPPFVNLQKAVDAAADGDTIVVAGGKYKGFTIDDKALTIVAAPNHEVLVQGTVQIRNLAFDRVVLLSGMKITGRTTYFVSEPGLEVTSSFGHVRIDGCAISGGSGWFITWQWPFGDGGDGVVLTASPLVVLTHCTIQGGNGSGEAGYEPGKPGAAGGVGVRLYSGSLTLDQCSVRGGDGGDGDYQGGSGGHGCWLGNTQMFSAGSSIRGGRGGDTVCIFNPAKGGNGGAGVYVDSLAQAGLLANTCIGGPGGGGPGCGSSNGQPGPSVGGPGLCIQYPGAARALSSPRVLFDESTWSVSVTAVPGDEVWLQIATRPSYVLEPWVPGVQLAKNAHGAPLFGGVVPASGQLQIQFGPPNLTTDIGRVFYLQGVGRDVLGNAWLGSPMHVLLLDRESPPDCNANQQSDLFDVLAGFSIDCGQNLVPDECDPDCDHNGRSDDCDLVLGWHQDCNENGVPDACDFAQGTSRDCNGNGVPDECDLKSERRPDLNGNGILDECEPKTTLWVDAGAAAGGNGSATAPFQTIAQALSSAVSGDEIVLRDGVYEGAGNRNLSLGGRTVVVRSEKGPADCVLDMQGLGRAFFVDQNVGPEARFEGLTFRNGFDGGDGGGALRVFASHPTIQGCVFESCSSSNQGGAIRLDNSGAQIVDCVFRRNGTWLYSPDYNQGGAIYFRGDWNFLTYLHYEGRLPLARILGCHFEGNESVNGGAIQSDEALPLSISHCTFLENTALASGGAIANGSWSHYGGVMNVDDCLFAGNRAGSGGGALWVSSIGFLSSYFSTEMRISCSSFVGNRASTKGGALWIEGGSSSRLVNCIAWDNGAALGPQIALSPEAYSAPPALHVERCDVQGGQAGVSNVGGQLTWAAGNLDIDPQFADPDGPDNNLLTYFDNDYRPIAGSPVNDAGDNALVPPDLNDIDGDGNTTEPTPLDLDLTRRFVEDLLAPNVGAGTPPLVDMGCYEHP